MQSTIHMRQLNLRIPGDNPETGHRVVVGIAQGLGQKVSVGMSSHFGALSVRVHVPAGATEAEMIDVIAEAMLRTLRRGNRGGEREPV